MKKRWLVLFLCFAFAFCLTGCSNEVLTAAGDAALQTILASVPEAAGRDWKCSDFSLDFGPAPFTVEEAGAFEYIWEEQEDGTVHLSIPEPFSTIANGFRLGGITLKLSPDQGGDVRLTARSIFEGNWYGYLHFKDAKGLWAGFDGYEAAAYAVFYFDDAMEGKPYLYVYMDDDEYPAFSAELNLAENRMSFQSGYFRNSPLSDIDAFTTEADLENRDLIYVESSFVDAANPEDSFSFTLALRPEGVIWPEGESFYPHSYASYLQDIEDGYIQLKLPYLERAAAEE